MTFFGGRAARIRCSRMVNVVRDPGRLLCEMAVFDDVVLLLCGVVVSE